MRFYRNGGHRHRYGPEDRCVSKVRNYVDGKWDGTWIDCGERRPGPNPNAKPRDECQVCERHQALTKRGRLGNHGYQRPGWGHIVGNCAGVGHKPFPETTALVPWLANVQDWLDGATALLAKLEAGEVTKIERRETDYTRWEGRRRATKLVTYEKPEGDPLPSPYGDPATMDLPHDDPIKVAYREDSDARKKWDEVYRSKLATTKSQVAALTSERNRVKARIEKAEKVKAERAA